MALLFHFMTVAGVELSQCLQGPRSSYENVMHNRARQKAALKCLVKLLPPLFPSLGLGMVVLGRLAAFSSISIDSAWACNCWREAVRFTQDLLGSFRRRYLHWPAPPSAPRRRPWSLWAWSCQPPAAIVLLELWQSWSWHGPVVFSLVDLVLVAEKGMCSPAIAGPHRQENASMMRSGCIWLVEPPPHPFSQSPGCALQSAIPLWPVPLPFLDIFCTFCLMSGGSSIWRALIISISSFCSASTFTCGGAACCGAGADGATSTGIWGACCCWDGVIVIGIICCICCGHIIIDCPCCAYPVHGVAGGGNGGNGTLPWPFPKYGLVGGCVGCPLPSYWYCCRSCALLDLLRPFSVCVLLLDLVLLHEEESWELSQASWDHVALPSWRAPGLWT